MSRLRQKLFEVSASTRHRNRDVAEEVRRLLGAGDSVLDAGCGEYGLAPFLPEAKVVGVDTVESKGLGDNFRFQAGSITALPFPDRSFVVAASVDTIEHLPERVRAKALEELVRVAAKGVVVSFPRGSEARQVDDDFRRELRRRGKVEPDWLKEHLSEPYPDEAFAVDAIEHAAKASGRRVELACSYSEWDTTARLIRAGHARSGKLGLVTDLLLGLLAPLVPRPARDRSYRAILVARFS